MAEKSEIIAATKSFAAKSVSVDMDARTVKHYITAPEVDADGDVVLPRGADLSRFKKSSVVFDVHQYGSRDVVGRCLNLQMNDDGIVAITRFSPRPPTLPEEQEWWPDTLLWLYSIGDIKGFSIGFNILDARSPTKQDIAKWGVEVQRVITRWKLLEYSVAPLPSLEDALTLSIKGMVSPRLAGAVKDGKQITRHTFEIPAEPVIEKQIIRMEVPAEVVAQKRFVFFVPPEAQPAAKQLPTMEETIGASALMVVRKARGELLV